MRTGESFTTPRLTTSISHICRLVARATLAATLLCTSFGAYAQSLLLDEVHTIAAPTIGVPKEHSFDVSVPGTYTVKLTDLGASLTPSAPLSSVRLAVTNGANVVGTPLKEAGTLTFDATVGTYVIHVVGSPGNVAGSGPILMDVNSAAGGATLATFSDTLALPTQALPNGEVVLDDSFTVAAAGSYQVALTDLKMPQPLGTLTLALFQQGGGIITTLPDQNNAFQSTVTLQPNVTYVIIAAGVAAANSAGLYSATVTPGSGGAAVYAKTLPVGSSTLLGSASLTAGGYSLVLTDLKYPAALSNMTVAVVQGGRAVATLGATDTKAFTAADGTCQVFGVGTADTAAGGGSYAVQLKSQAGTVVFDNAQAAVVPGGVLTAYNYSATITTAGPYLASVSDYQFPAVFSSLALEVVQGSTVLAAPPATPGTPTVNTGTQTVNASSGPISLLVFAQPGTAGGLFGVNLASGGAANPVFANTQGVGGLFTSTQLTVTTAGTYEVIVADLAFPAKFANLDVIVTQGNNKLGSVFGAGHFIFTATPGNYFLNFVAQPDATEQAGTYAASVGPAPPAPVVNLTSDQPNVAQNGTVTLKWTTQNATTCTAADGWTGTKDTSGTATSVALTGTTTFTLSCTGDGGTTTQSVTVTVDPPAKGGGGGAIDAILCGLLSLLLVLHVRRRDRSPLRG
jgi:hypothetical protein